MSRDFQSGRVLFFVTGRSKSGTTWMGRLLNSHADIFCDISENNAFHQDFEFRYFGSLTSDMDVHFAEFFESRLWRLIKNGFITNLISRCDKQSVRLFGDKTPRQDVNRIIAMFPETKIVIMLRDFRDVAVSLAFHQQRGIGTWVGSFANSRKQGLDEKFLEKHLVNYEKHLDFQVYSDLAGRLPEQVMIVKYEDLITNAHTSLEKVFSFLNVGASRTIVRACIARNSFARLSAGRKPGEADESSFFRKGIVGDWKHYFSAENVETFKRIAGETLIVAGYERDNNWTL